ncbi:MAG: hypothetical protein AB1610_07280 [Nitrospirota bacterium]
MKTIDKAPTILLGHSAIEVFKTRGISPIDLNNRLIRIEKNLGPTIFSQLIKRPIEDQSTAELICERSAILSILEACPCFSKVVKSIKRDPNGSLHEPKGEWLQLVMGAFLKSMGENVYFEQSVKGSPPKDILFRDKSIQVECKAFLLSPFLQEIWKAHSDLFMKIKNDFPRGNWQIEFNNEWTHFSNFSETNKYLKLPVDIENFERQEILPNTIISKSDHKMDPIGSWDSQMAMGIIGTSSENGMEIPFSASYSNGVSILFKGPYLDQLKRIISGIKDKQRQMVKGIFNIISLDAEMYTGDRASLPTKLTEMLTEESLLELYGILIVDKKMELSGTTVSLTLIKNPVIESSIPPDIEKNLLIPQKFI